MMIWSNETWQYGGTKRYKYFMIQPKNMECNGENVNMYNHVNLQLVQHAQMQNRSIRKETQII